MLSRLRRVNALMEEDASRELDDLHERDRAIGVALAHLERRPHAQILAWSVMRGVDVSVDGDRALAALARLLAALGFVLGVLTAAGALYFEGGGRVNVVALMAVLVGLQLVSLLITLIGMLPTAWRRRVPGLGAASETLSVLSPAAALLHAARRWLPPLAHAAGALVADTARDARLFARVRRWTLWRLSQGFAVTFNLGLLAALASLVVFTDLAFGWSTTLDVSPEAVHRIAEIVAWPWRSLVPAAVPGPELVELTRFFRAAAPAQVDAALLGHWWPFVLVSLVVYGLAPRVFLYAFARWRWTRSVRWTLLHLPGAAELLYRLNTASVTRRGEGEESVERTPPASPPAAVTPASGACTLIVWGAFGDDAERIEEQVRRATGLEPRKRLHAGVAVSLDEDRRVIDAVAGSASPLVIAVKSWEPPLAEVTDFLADLRRVSREARPLLVVPLPEPGRDAPAASDVTIWRSRLARLGDPWLGVRAPSAAVNA